jgi:iron complex outermembrane receptor protein
VTLLLLFLVPVPTTAQPTGEDAQAPGDSLDSASDESLLFQEIPSVFGASKYEQKVTEAPASVSIITAEEIKRYGYRTLADILRSVRGFYTSYDRNFSYAGIRGFSRPGDFNSRLLILVDGFRNNDGVYNAGTIDREFPVDVDLIDRVEVARGPSASLYGTSAFFGVVNIITKTGRQLSGGQLAGSLGSYDAGQGRVTYGDRWANGVDLIVSGTLMDAGGQDLFFPQFADLNGGVAVGVDYERTENFFGKVTYRDFTVQADYVSRTKGIPTGSYDTAFNEPGTFTTDGSIRLGAIYDHRFRSGLALTGRVGYDDIYEDGEYVYDWAEEEGDPPDLVTNIDRIQTQRITSEITLTKQLGENHRVVAGSEYRDNFKLHQNNFDLEVYQDDTRDSSVFGLYVQDEFWLTENLILNAGLRYDRYGFDSTSSNVSPRIAMIYSPFQDTTVKVLYGEAFRAPSAYELYFDDGGYFNKAALTLKPELMRSTEVVLEQQLGRAWQVTGSVFRYSIDDLITGTLDPVDEFFVFANVESMAATGAEVEVEGRTETGWVGRAGYSVQRAHEQPVDMGDLTNSPRHMSKFNLIAPLIDEKVFAGTEGIYVSGRKTLMDSQADGFFLTNLTVSSPALLSGWDVSLSVYNLFDQRYGDPGSGEHLQDVILRDGRNFRVKLTYNFGVR